MNVPFQRPLCLFVLLLMSLALAACSTTGYSTKASLQIPRVIRAPSAIPPELVPHAARFVELLQAKGFSVGRTDDPRALDLIFEFNGNPFNLRVSVGLWREGIPVLSASATNSGWGTVIARGPAVSSLVDSTVQQFRTELSNMLLTTKVLTDAK